MRGNNIAFLVIFSAVFGIVGKVSAHPFFVSVTEIRMDTKKSSLTVSCRMFTDDLETALNKIYGKQFDLINATNNESVQKTVDDYIQKRFSIGIDGTLQTLNFVGMEKEDESMWFYLESSNFIIPKNMTVTNWLLYDFVPAQTNIIHTYLNDEKQSTRLINPDKAVNFKF